MKTLILILFSLIPVFSQAQTYSVNWYKVAGGGGASTGTNGANVFSLSGTIGQHDAGGAMSGGAYSVTGGFWSLISVVQTAGMPNLTIVRSGSSVIVAWPNTGSYTLQQNSNLGASAGWAMSGYSVSTNASGTNTVTITAPAGSLFFRLANPQ
jgi:hypothetical protein